MRDLMSSPALVGPRQEWLPYWAASDTAVAYRDVIEATYSPDELATARLASAFLKENGS